MLLMLHSHIYIWCTENMCFTFSHSFPQINEPVLFWVLAIRVSICPRGVCILVGQTLHRYVYFR